MDIIAMTDEAIILAGGFGTRLKGVINDIPKPMAPIGDEPFLSYILRFLEKNGIKRVVLAVGYKHNVISDFYGNRFGSMTLHYAIENDPLGTGGAIQNALKMCIRDTQFLVNGDTFFDLDFNVLHSEFTRTCASLCFALKPMEQFDRYGVVETREGKVAGFAEKKWVETGLINGGVYLLNRNIFEKTGLSGRFSFENDYMAPFVGAGSFSYVVSDTYFIDIGIPDDYAKAQKELPVMFKNI